MKSRGVWRVVAVALVLHPILCRGGDLDSWLGSTPTGMYVGPYKCPEAGQLTRVTFFDVESGRSQIKYVALPSFKVNGVRDPNLFSCEQDGPYRWESVNRGDWYVQRVQGLVLNNRARRDDLGTPANTPFRDADGNVLCPANSKCLLTLTRVCLAPPPDSSGSVSLKIFPCARPDTDVELGANLCAVCTFKSYTVEPRAGGE